MQGEVEHVTPLGIDHVSRIHFRGGSHLGISRANPTTDPVLLENTVSSLLSLGVSQLITIGGDDTAFSAMKLVEHSGGRLRVVHVPKTIDNDLDLPPHIDTFGFQTARHVGVELVKNLMVDAKTTSHWFFVTSMGRKAGHLALGIGKAAGATLTIVPEEFSGATIALDHMADILVASIVKRLAYGRPDGVAVLAEGLVEHLSEAELLKYVPEVERDEHDHIRIAEVEFGPIIKTRVAERLKDLGIKTTIVSKNIGYELRCTDPIPFDMEYTRDLGYCAAKFLIEGGSGAMVTIQRGHFKPIRFEEMLDPKTGRTRVRMVDTDTEHYKIARRYMLRLRRDDFQDAAEIAKYAAVAGLSADAFKKRFEYLVKDEAPPLSFELT
jgi:6-phosphofructokinase 1